MIRPHISCAWQAASDLRSILWPSCRSHRFGTLETSLTIGLRRRIILCAPCPSRISISCAIRPQIPRAPEASRPSIGRNIGRRRNTVVTCGTCGCRLRYVGPLLPQLVAFIMWTLVVPAGQFGYMGLMVTSATWDLVVSTLRGTFFAAALREIYFPY